MTSNIGDFEKAIEEYKKANAKLHQILAELDEKLKEIRLFLEKWRKECQTHGK